MTSIRITEDTVLKGSSTGKPYYDPSFPAFDNRYQGVRSPGQRLWAIDSHALAMSAIVKPKLKAARDAITNKDYEKAKDASLSVLDYEPDNYMA